MRHFIVLLSSTLLLLLSGCILPVPHKRIHECGVKGVIVDAASHAPLAGVQIQDTLDSTKVVYSAADGTFYLLPIYGWHGAYVLAGASGSDFPVNDKETYGRTITITAEGYRKLTIPLGRSSQHEAYIWAGDIAIER